MAGMSATPEFRTLVAEPSTHMAGLVAVMLHSLKIRIVDEATDRMHAERALLQRSYNLMLIDAELGAEDSFGLIRSLRTATDHLNRHLPIIMMASAPSATLIVAARDAGVTEFLRKPFSAQHIQLRLDAILNAPREFVAAESYVGPDRRRRTISVAKPRRAADKASA